MTEFEKFNAQNANKIEELSRVAVDNCLIDSTEYLNRDVKRGLRDVNGNGVVAGLTQISDIISSKKGANGEKLCAEGELYYRGINIKHLVDGYVKEKRYGFEEVAYLLLFGKMPTAELLDEFKTLISGYRSLPPSFVRDIIMKAPSTDMMNVLARSVLALYSYDNNPDDISPANVLRQCLQLISQLPLLAIYGYQVFSHYHDDNSLIIHNSNPDLSIAENILHLMRQDSNFTELEAEILDRMLILHAEHGGGNNSTFTMHVVSSSATDTYSSVAAALGSLKGPRHGGANIKVVKMIEDMKANLKKFDDNSIADYMGKLLKGEAFDRTGLIYGMGHAVYSMSDPRADILRGYVKRLAEEKNLMDEFNLYEKVAKIAPQVISEKRKIFKGVSANIDFYSGFVYSMLGIPVELFTPLFAVSRIVGWSAHRIEELANNGKIIRPSYISIAKHREYIPLKDRTKKNR